MECFFNGCINPVVGETLKCLFHSHRGRCVVEECRNQVYARNLCVRHGGKRRCAFEGCKLNSRVGNFCTKHGPSDAVRRCSQDGCFNQAHLRGKCFRHGGSRFCKVDGCVTYARNRGYCTRHTPRNNSPKCIKSKEKREVIVEVMVKEETVLMACNEGWIQQELLEIEPTKFSFQQTCDDWIPQLDANCGWDEMICLLADV